MNKKNPRSPTDLSGKEVAERLAETDKELRYDVEWLWRMLIEIWMKRVKSVDSIRSVSTHLVGADEMMLHTYWETERFDLDYLSGEERDA